MKDSQEGQLERGHLLYKGSPSTCVGSDIQDRQLPECEYVLHAYKGYQLCGQAESRRWQRICFNS